MTPPRLEVVALTKSFGGLRAVENVSFKVAPAEVVGLVGPNGAGKSTIVDLITGAQTADSGEARIDGMVLKGAPAKRARMGGLARTFQRPQLAMEMTVRENLLLGKVSRRMATPISMVRSFVAGAVGADVVDPQDEHAVEAWASSLGVKGLDRMATNLTLGEMRLVELARALLRSPKVVLLDEPLAGSDAKGVEGVLAAIEQIAKSGCAVVLIDHNVDLVARACSRLILLDFGRVVLDERTDECLKSAEMGRVYFSQAQADTV